MRKLIGRRDPLDLDRRLALLRVALDNAEGRLAAVEIQPALGLVQRAGERLGFGAETTVVALAGATGSGKSSLFNALSGTALAEVGVRRPTTSTAQASVWGDASVDGLLDWLDVPRRHRVADPELSGLVLLDLPDHDSTEVEHRLEVDRLVELVDLFVWVVDPQKYADAALHQGYLKPLATHAPVTLFVMNQRDRITDDELDRCVTDLKRLVVADGMKSPEVVTTSARSGEGVADLRAAIAERVEEKRAAAERLDADVDRVARELSDLCDGDPGPGLQGREERTLVATLSDAAGVGTVTEAVARSHRRDAALATGWPVTRWARKLRPDPLGRLHLRGSSGGRTSLPGPSQVQQAQVETALRNAAESASERLPEPWRRSLHAKVSTSTDGLLEVLDRTISRADIAGGRRPRWWSVAGSLQLLVALAAGIGFVWVTLLFALQYFQIPRPPTPKVGGDWPVPTVLLFGGLLLGFLLGVLFAVFARVGAARRRRYAQKRLEDDVQQVASERILQPIEVELQAYKDFCAAVGQLTPRGS